MENNHLKRVEWVDLELPSLQKWDRFFGWAIGRATFSMWFFGLTTLRTAFKVGLSLVDQTEKASHHLLDVYAQMPHMGVMGAKYMDTTATLVIDIQPITDVITAIEGKQVMVIGEMGTGKSTLAQYLAYTIGGSIKVYECEGTPEDWQGLNVIGKGEDFDAIESGMQADLEDLSNQLKIRNERGDNALTGTEKVIICEEYPELVSKCESSGEWLERHARRGRKARRFTILLSQYDRVAAWGLEGKADLAEAFRKLRLGKKAVMHAKTLKREDLIDWLKQDRSHCLLDDEPCKLPAYREMKAVTQRLSLPGSFSPVVTAETTAEQAFQPIPVKNNQDEKMLARVVKACLGAGFSDTKIIKEILGYEGSQYNKGKRILEELKRE
jgi:energy-coupling factor transporter ATP-binding protein EcfA2